MVRRVLLTGAAAVTTLAIAGACSGTRGIDHGSPGQPMASASSGGMHNSADLAFARMMVSHHQQAVEMATLAQTRADDPEIKSIAAGVMSAQEPEIATITSWLAARGMPTAGAGHNMSRMPGMISDDEMTQMKAATGVDFDRMFARMMIAHHKGAIQMCGNVTAEGADPQVKAFADTIEHAQSAEVAILQTILDRL